MAKIKTAGALVRAYKRFRFADGEADPIPSTKVLAEHWGYRLRQTKASRRLNAWELGTQCYYRSNERMRADFEHLQRFAEEHGFTVVTVDLIHFKWNKKIQLHWATVFVRIEPMVSEPAADRGPLSEAEYQAMRLYHLGGVEAWRTDTHHVHTNTVASLMRKGYFTTKTVTPLGKRYIAKYVIPACDGRAEDPADEPEVLDPNACYCSKCRTANPPTWEDGYSCCCSARVVGADKLD